MALVAEGVYLSSTPFGDYLHFVEGGGTVSMTSGGSLVLEMVINVQPCVVDIVVVYFNDAFLVSMLQVIGSG